MDFDLYAKLDRMSEIRKAKPAYEDLMLFYEKLFRTRDRYAQALQLPAPKVDRTVLAVKIKEGFPVLDKSAVVLDMETLPALFIDLLKTSREKNPEATEDIGYFFQRKNVEVSTIIQNMWDGDLEFLGQERKELHDPFLLYFLLVETLKPVYTYYAKMLEKHLSDVHWEHGYCPVCGELPSISETSKGNSRKELYCVYCETGWTFQPQSCPFCGKEEEAGRKRLYADNAREYAIELCEECGKYIKVVDMDILGRHVPLDVENIATIHLDMLAQQEGFERGAPIQLLV